MTIYRYIYQPRSNQLSNTHQSTREN